MLIIVPHLNMSLDYHEIIIVIKKIKKLTYNFKSIIQIQMLLQERLE